MHQPELSVLAFQRHGERQLVATLGCQIFVRGFIQSRSPVTAHPPVLVSVAVILSAGDKHQLMVTHHAVYPVGGQNPLQESPGFWPRSMVSPSRNRRSAALLKPASNNAACRASNCPCRSPQTQSTPTGLAAKKRCGVSRMLIESSLPRLVVHSPSTSGRTTTTRPSTFNA